MDLKGIAWAGNIYQKFEAMCIEVEEVMYQDTVKYLENQVQTVGSSVKKFYSEVMQDIGDPDYVDPVKVAAADLPLNPYSHTEVNKKKKVTMKQDLENLRKKKYEDYKVAGDINAEHKEALAKRDYSIDHAKVFSNSYSGNKRAAGLYRRHSVNNKGNFKTEIPYKMSKETNLGSELLSEATSLCQQSKESETCSPSDKVCDAKEARCVDNSACSSTSQVDSPARGVDLSRDIKAPSLLIPSGTSDLASDGVCEAREARSVDNSSCTSTAQVDSPTSGVNLSSDTKEPNLVILSGTSDTDLDSKQPPHVGSGNERICVSVPDEAVISLGERSDDSEIDIELEIIERLDESKFEDTCVLVEGNELQVVPQKKGKSKSYKKKFQDTFPLRMKSTRKQEYKKLAAQYSAHSSKEGMEQHGEGVPYSEWELL